MRFGILMVKEALKLSHDPLHRDIQAWHTDTDNRNLSNSVSAETRMVWRWSLKAAAFRSMPCKLPPMGRKMCLWGCSQGSGHAAAQGEIKVETFFM